MTPSSQEPLQQRRGAQQRRRHSAGPTASSSSSSVTGRTAGDGDGDDRGAPTKRRCEEEKSSAPQSPPGASADGDHRPQHNKDAAASQQDESPPGRATSAQSKGPPLHGPERRRSKKGDDIQGLFRRGAVMAWIMYVSLLLMVKQYAPMDSYEVPDGPEKFAHLSSLVLLLVANGGRILPLLLKSLSSTDGTHQLLQSGFLVGTLTVQGIAVSGNALMAFVPTPVYLDPVTGLRCHLVRWVEWTALAFLLTFFTTNLEAPIRSRGRTQRGGGEDGGGVTYGYAISLGLSTMCGLVFPFCPSAKMWMAVMVASCLLFLPIYEYLHKALRRHYRSSRQLHAPERGAGRWDVTSDVDDADVLRISVVLGSACTVTWTGLVLFYIVACAGRVAHLQLFASPYLLSVGLCFFEVASKVWYLSVLIDAYEQVFDENSRLERRLGHLRDVMGAIWETSSDVIVFCEEVEGVVHAIVSPAFLKLVEATMEGEGALCKDPSLMLRVDERSGDYTACAVDLSTSRRFHSKQSMALEAGSVDDRVRHPNDRRRKDATALERSLTALVELLLRTSATRKRDHDLSWSQHRFTELARPTSGGTNPAPVHCEVKRSAATGEGSYVLVLRDISDRVQRFESEKLLLQQLTERKKDEEATKFTRHETKNGILAAIALLDQIKENLAQNAPEETGQEASRKGQLVPTLESDFTELEITLREVLDTALERATAREVVHGHYMIRKEPVRVPEVLSSIYRSSPRFPLRIVGGQIPDLALDRQLIRCIHRTAVTSACEHGNGEGTVETILSYDPDALRFVMEVLKETGDREEERSSAAAVSSALPTSPSPHLLAHITPHHAESPGNGAWIMEKCAEAHDGTCTIRSEPQRYEIRFSCRAEPVTRGKASVKRLDGEAPPFAIPPGTWGIAVDDSCIQRKLMNRFMKRAGIREDRTLILGETAEQMLSMDAMVASLMALYPNDKFILIVDENLDVLASGTQHRTISGSQCVERLRNRLDPHAERRLLALIRSANDALPDVQLYKSRAHGYMHKEPMQKEVLEVIKPWWVERFREASDTATGSPPRPGGETDNLYEPSLDEILASVGVINELVEGMVHNRNIHGGDSWSNVREKLLMLKGDVKTFESQKAEAIAALVESLNLLVENPNLPESFSEQWAKIRLLLDECM